MTSEPSLPAEQSHDESYPERRRSQCDQDPHHVADELSNAWLLATQLSPEEAVSFKLSGGRVRIPGERTKNAMHVSGRQDFPVATALVTSSYPAGTHCVQSCLTSRFCLRVQPCSEITAVREASTRRSRIRRFCNRCSSADRRMVAITEADGHGTVQRA